MSAVTYQKALELETEENGVTDLSESLKHVCPQVWVLHDRFKASVVVFKDTWQKRKGKNALTFICIQQNKI